MRDHIGQYRIEAELGRGGMGVVYRGLHEHLAREVAIKALAPELTRQPEFKERFFSEAKTQARLQHPGIVGVYDLLAEGGEYFIVMELVSGVGLDDRMRDLVGQGMDWGEALEIFGQMLAALDYAHSEGVIHRDIKPSNVLITPGGRVKLTDFGIALLVGDKRLTASQSTIGTPTYMSPEQILRPRSMDHRTDIYSAAVVFFEMLAGRPPFDDETEYGIKKLHVEAAPPDLSLLREELPAGICETVAIALRKDPEERYPSAGAFLRALHAASPPGDLPAGATPPAQPVFRPTVSSSPPPAARPAVSPLRGLLAGKRSRLLLGTAALLAAVLGCGGLLLIQLFRGSGPVVAEAVPASPPSVETLAPSMPMAAEQTSALKALPLEPPVPAPPPPSASSSAPVRKSPPARSRKQQEAPAPAPLAPPEPEPVAMPEPEEPVMAETEPVEHDPVLERFREMDAVIVSLEDLSKRAWKAYKEADRDTALGPKLASFRDAAVALRKEFRTVTGTGGVFTKLRRRSSDTRKLESQARDLLRRSGEIEGLIAGDSGDPRVESSWREIRRQLERLEGFFP